MIELTVVTTMQFKSEAELRRYIGSPDVARVTGFAKEIQTAWETKELLTVRTERPRYGVVTESFISVQDKTERPPAPSSFAERCHECNQFGFHTWDCRSDSRYNFPSKRR